MISGGDRAEATSDSGPYKWQRAWTTLKTLIPKHIDNPATRLSEVQSQELFVSTSFKQVRNPIRIDVIGMVHGGPFEAPPNIDQEINASDKKVLALLDHLNQDSVGVEGSNCEQLTMDCFIRDVIRRVEMSYGFTPRKADVMQKVENSITGQPWIRYMKKHPKIPMAGLSDPIGLDELHGYLIELDLGGVNERAVLDVRTDIGIARMIAFMKKRKLRHGVVLFGTRHVERAEALLRYMKIQSTTY
ncbi:hypothetical protein HY620_03230 [Candidatus Uhrbacteria bacterium]|nr:hypothetical protein [Candidatus Uhrbacteria bacterium]